MPVKTSDITQVQPSLGDLLPLVIGGTEITLTRNDAPLIRLVSAAMGVAPKPRQAGLHQGDARMSEDFGEPLPEAFWGGTQ